MSEIISNAIKLRPLSFRLPMSFLSTIFANSLDQVQAQLPSIPNRLPSIANRRETTGASRDSAHIKAVDR